jgi:hypothetical protein
MKNKTTHIAFPLSIILLMLFTLGSSFYTSSYAQIIVTYAGNGVAGYSGNGGQATAAELYSPNFATLDASGNLYIGI